MTSGTALLRTPHRSARAALLALTLGAGTIGAGIATSGAVASAATTTTTSTTVPVAGANCAASLSAQSPLDRNGWVASSNAPSTASGVAPYALDGNIKTRFTTDEHQLAGLYFQVDLGAQRTFDELDMASPNSPTDYARAFQVQVSNDAKSWTTVAACSGKATPEVVSFATHTDEFIRVILTAPVPKYWWSIDEFNLYAKNLVTTTTATPPKVTAIALSASANPSHLGQPITYTATVTPTPTGGTVSFFANGAPVTSCAKVPVSTSTGKAACATVPTASGPVAVQAFYSGYATYEASTSKLFAETVSPPAAGYWLATANGQVFGLGGATAFGSMQTSAQTGPVVGIASTPDARGYWVVTADGKVGAFGDAKFYGDLPDMGKHVTDVVAIGPTADGNGYYMVGADGGFFTFGDAKFHGSIPGLHIHVKDIVGMVASSTGEGYLLVGSDGGVFTFGTTRFFGSLPGIGKHVHDIRAILPSAAGTGYILVGADGGAFNFGSGVKFHGSVPGEGIRITNIVGIALTPDDGGYYMAGSDGHVYAFGDAQAYPTPSTLAANLPVAAIAGT
ncbi:MAG TPA: discoidin domain-containing protein [Acidimicrobiales bacterium]|nr:discoidin domain-containing protein [Acidimicrobiales bacterium]